MGDGWLGDRENLHGRVGDEDRKGKSQLSAQ